MFRYQKVVFSPFWAMGLAVLILGLPFVHSHPRTTHDSHSGQHSHTAVIHTVFSADSAGEASPSVGDHDSKTLVELFRTAIDLNFFAKRSSVEAGKNLLTVTWVSYDLSNVAINSALPFDSSLSPPESRRASPHLVRGPPSHLFS